MSVDVPIRSPGRHAGSAPGRVARRLALIGLAALLVVDALLIANAIRVVQSAGAAVTYPFELDFGEGLVLAPTRALAAGGSIYRPAEETPAVISNYTPVYYAAAAGLGTAMGNFLAAGRALSLASALLAAGVLAALAWRAIDPASGRLVRALATVCGGLAFLQVSYTASWAALMRVDLLAVLLAFAGVLVFGATAAHGRRMYWCLIPFLLALYTKQTTAAAAAACVLTAARGSVRRGLALGGAFAVAAVLVGAALQASSGGGFVFHVIAANVQPYSWEQSASFLQDIAIRYPVLVALAVASAPGLLASLPRGVPATPSRRAEGRNWTRAALGAYLPLAALTTLTVGKLGAEVNYLIELMGVVSLCATVAVADALVAPASDAAAQAPNNYAAIAAVAVPTLLLWQVAWLAPSRTIEWAELATTSEQAQLGRLTDLVRRVDGPVLSEDLTLLSLADKPIEFEPFNITQLTYPYARDEGPLLAALDQQTFRLVVLRFDVRNPPPLAFTRFTPATIDTIRARYVLRSTFPGYWLYAPKTAPVAPSRTYRR